VKLTSILAIYTLFWVICAFMALPFGVRTHDEAGLNKVPGQADSAPANFDPRRIAVRATVASALLMALFYANYVNGWIGAEELNVFGDPPSAEEKAA